MADLMTDAQQAVRTAATVVASPKRTSLRVLGYAWRYKVRLICSILFAAVLAASFSSMLMCVGATLKLIFEEDAKFAASVGHTVEMVKAYAETANDYVPALSIDPAQAGQKVNDFIYSLRTSRTETVQMLCVALVIVAFLGGTARFLQEYFAGSIGTNISIRMGQEMFANIMRLSISFFERRTTGEILARFTNDVFQVNRGLAEILIRLFREPIMIVFYLGIAFWTDWRLTLIILLVIPPMAYLIYTIGNTIKRSVRRSLQKVGSMAGVSAETINGIAVVKAYCMEDYETQRVNAELNKLKRYLYRMIRSSASVGPTSEFLLSFGVVAFLLMANQAFDADPPRLDTSKMAVLLGALFMSLDPFRKLSTVNNLIQNCVASAERVFEFIDVEPDVREAEDAVEIGPLEDSLRFDHVQFAYGDKDEVLKDVNFEVKKGEMVALVGFSGAGKSTIVKLIPRFYDITGGAITIDGVDIRKATFKSLRDQISIVTQDTILFNESVRDNIAYGKACYTPERVEQAARAAHAHQFIQKLPNGYDTNIGESGGTLSGGQRQRLAIARAIIKDPAILILDEATSSLDSESEQAIQKAIEEFVVGRTTLIIAHRLSTIQRADRILVVNEGRIAEAGSHQELLARNGLYRRLYDVQFSTKEESPTP